MNILVGAGLCTLRREHGQDMAEYALMIALIAVIAVVAITYLGRTIGNTLYNGLVVNIESVLP